MICVEDALKIVREKMPKWSDVSVPLASVHNVILQEDIRADREYPPYHRAMLDGIAVSFHAFQEGQRQFRIVGECAAGLPQQELLDPVTCFEVMTGASMPANTDLVIPYEDLKIENNLATVNSTAQRQKLEFVHLKGGDAAKGEVLIKKGSRMNGPRWGIAASVGLSTLRVPGLPRIHLISSGNELVAVNETPLDHQIRVSNVHALSASLRLFGYHQIEISHLPDNPQAIREHYLHHANDFALMIYSGGVSKGKHDYFPEVWKNLGVEKYFHGVSQRPGKPFWFGVDQNRQTVIFGLPGNPVSSLVCLHKYFLSRNEIYAELSDDFVFEKSLTLFLPVRVEWGRDGRLRARPLNIKNSGEFTALAESDGMLELPRDATLFKAGESFLFHPWSPM